MRFPDTRRLAKFLQQLAVDANLGKKQDRQLKKEKAENASGQNSW